MVADAGKHVAEGDAEVSEAIDFAEYYRRCVAELDALGASLDVRPRGVVLVTPPWNFPLAIAAGGVFAALAAGNTVLLKPAPETPWVAFELAQLCWQAGIPREVLQFVPCANEPAGSALVRDPRVAAVILTGGTATARRFQAMRPELPLFAETGGKNAMIVSEMADWDLAIKNALHGAFGHAGQKCSATSLLILEAALYDDPRFLERLSDATRSLHVGSAWDLAAKVTPLIREPRADLAWNLAGGLEPGESWLVAPRPDPENPRLWSPGVKLGVRPGSRTYESELFGPILGVMRAADLDDALRLANGVSYGLTAGLVSLDDREVAHWLAHVDAGCLYVNRGTTGAIVRRQPFGGVKQSVFGPGAKAGGPNYLLQLVTLQDRASTPPDDDAAAFATHFAHPTDPSRILGQDNTLRYRPARVAVRVAASATARDVTRVMSALAACAPRDRSMSIEVSCAAELEGAPWLTALTPPARAPRFESATVFAARLGTLGEERLRVLGTLEPELLTAAHAAHVHVEASPVVAPGRVELLRYLREETVSYDYHRFGNLGPRTSPQVP
jgi:RHH-type proline utilization regulon transcriptional repressor/proline dehydrogenase/delta 1-pyrroline-5-carboxylate dehydrogenase